ncbi:hypothetical protein CGCA056_v000941 [Colletotrichum aenigma]|uniref:uncharacterized protein n=1 Tax=Colletotrichum aenigma TaxID=1215731 RepID=UPI0018732753|nr:uncharacterized protein CGCA056_v000941 [Colletotrichum aenigma]KAF5527126.1 hypothetical protein CGCA056_v000941 [Colletotrichum aenigma]
MLKTDLNNDTSKKRITVPDEPTAQEVGQGGSLECRGVWVGWYLPLEDLQFNHKVHKGLSVKRLCEGDGADSQIAAARAIAPTTKALRVILQLGRGFINIKYHALAYPDADTVRPSKLTGAQIRSSSSENAGTWQMTSGSWKSGGRHGTKFAGSCAECRTRIQKPGDGTLPRITKNGKLQAPGSSYSPNMSTTNLNRSTDQLRLLIEQHESTPNEAGKALEELCVSCRLMYSTIV